MLLLLLLGVAVKIDTSFTIRVINDRTEARLFGDRSLAMVVVFIGERLNGWRISVRRTSRLLIRDVGHS